MPAFCKCECIYLLCCCFFLFKNFCLYIYTLLWLVCIPENRIAALQRGVSFYFCVWDSPFLWRGAKAGRPRKPARPSYASGLVWKGSLFLPSTLSSQDTPPGQLGGRGWSGGRAPHYHPPPWVTCHPAWERKYATSGSISKDQWDPQWHSKSQGDQSNVAKVLKIELLLHHRPLIRWRLACWISVGWVSPNITCVSR